MSEIRFIKRGLPKLYELTLSKSTMQFSLFHKKLHRFINELFHNKSVKSLSIYKGDILTEISVQISYDSKCSSWIVSIKKQYSVAFKDQNDIKQLLQQDKIGVLLYNVCQYWLNVLCKMSYANVALYKDFLLKCDNKTLIGFYDDTDITNNNGKKIIFELFVYNMEQFNQFAASFGEMDFFFQKYNLPYHKLKRLSQYNIQNIEHLHKAINDLYKISAYDIDNSSTHKGNVFFLSSDSKYITTGFKIKKQELCVSSQLTKTLLSKPGCISEKCVNSQIKQSSESFLKLLGTCLLHNSTNCKCESYLKQQHIQKTTIGGNLFLIENNSYISENDNCSNDGKSNLVLLPNCLADIQKIKSNGTSIHNANEEDNGIRTPLQKSSNGNSVNQITKSLSKPSKDFSIRELSTFDTSTKYKLYDVKNNTLKNIKKTNSSHHIRIRLSTVNSLENKEKGKKVRFVDEKYYIPLVEVIDIKSYKEFNGGRKDGDNKKKQCCCVM